jgi:hypothetical protein
LAVNNLHINPGDVVTTYGKRAHAFTGKVVGNIPRGYQLWVVTNPPTNRKTYLQGRIEPVGGQWAINVNVGRTDDQTYNAADPVTIILVDEEIGKFLAGCGGSNERNPIVPNKIPRQEVAQIAIFKKRP